jgi:hypothetical protein
LKCSIKKEAIESGHTNCFLGRCPLRKVPISDAELARYASMLAIHLAQGTVTREDSLSVV